ncbi:phosphotransferase [Paenibacillus sp. RC67]|uniref:phosphotransferase n=1 Tax=Paenibacillus sp. RC67 TaxID=3039392 RepID=UPI0024ACED1A|nr:phosphotransferase [Paenibacillus sp. RC67]
MSVQSEKQADICIDSAMLHSALKMKYPLESIHIVSWYNRPLGEVKSETEVHRIHCALLLGEFNSCCTLILKILRPDAARAGEDHYYYWKREVLVYHSGILEQLPDTMRAPVCYLIEEQSDGCVWVWMEDIDEQRLDTGWNEKEQIGIAFGLGKFNGAYLTGLPVPTESFLCTNWMNSWVQVIESYLQSMEEQKAVWHKHQLDHINPNVYWDRYESSRLKVADLLDALNQLPQVFAHQDIHSGNVYMEQYKGQDRLVAIDWQFASLSGVGEELGRMFGLTLRKHVDMDTVYKHKEALVQSYLDGLREVGWDGNANGVRYGFAVAASLRFVMLMGKLLTTVEKPNYSITKRDHLLSVIQLMLDMLDEAWQLRNDII